MKKKKKRNRAKNIKNIKINRYTLLNNLIRNCLKKELKRKIIIKEVYEIKVLNRTERSKDYKSFLCPIISFNSFLSLHRLKGDKINAFNFYFE